MRKKCGGWTAGSKLGKFMVLSVKNWAFLELLLNVDRLRVDFKGMEGLFSKMSRAKG